jgi:hypothetical protein
VTRTAPLVLFQGTFDRAAQEQFSLLSGDCNPIHLNAALARRQFYGRRILHGLHGVMRALDSLMAHRRCHNFSPATPSVLKARFLAPVFLREPVRVVLEEHSSSAAALSLRQGGAILYEIAVCFGAGTPSAGPVPSGGARGGAPQALAFEALAGRKGRLPLWLDRELLTALFPHLARVLPAPALAGLLSTTRLVGMECPGMQSLLSRIDVAFDPDGASTELSYHVLAADARFSLVKLSVEGGGLSGVVDAFYRPVAVTQTSYGELRSRVVPTEFRGARALVIGGDRGAGEVAAKLLAAGGAEVILTYYRLRGEAVRAMSEIRNGGGGCDILCWDACSPAGSAARLAERGWLTTHVLYFATPRLDVRRGPGFSRELFRSLQRVGIDGLVATLQAIRAVTPGPLSLFLPSTTLLDGDGPSLKGHAEFAASKAASETLCRALAAHDRLLTSFVGRLPRLHTDQGQALSPRVLAQPEEHLLPLLRRFVHQPVGHA